MGADGAERNDYFSTAVLLTACKTDVCVCHTSTSFASMRVELKYVTVVTSLKSHENGRENIITDKKLWKYLMPPTYLQKSHSM
jgi:hypothetical protein